MLQEKRKKLRLINGAAYLIFAATSLSAYFLPFNSNNVLTMESKYPNLISGPAFSWYLFFATLLGLTLFILFQARNLESQSNVPAKTLDALGWTVSAAFILYAAAITLWHFERLGLAIIVLLFLLLVLLIANGNIRERPQLMDEKLWVRNPFSLFLGWTLYLLMETIAMGWPTLFSAEAPALILFVVFLILVLVIANTNLNLGVAVLWMLLLGFKELQNSSGALLGIAFWAGIAALAITSISILLKPRQRHYSHSPVAKAMDKYNYGQGSQIKGLENELNQQLQTKPGAKITFR